MFSYFFYLYCLLLLTGADNQRESVVNEAHPANTTADLAAADPPASHPLPDNSASVNTSRTIPHKTGNI